MKHNTGLVKCGAGCAPIAGPIRKKDADHSGLRPFAGPGPERRILLEQLPIFFGEQDVAQTPDAAVQVAADQRLNGIQVFFRDDAQHLFMLGQNVRHIVGPDDIQPDKAGVIRLGAGDLLPQILLVGMLKPDLVHMQVVLQKMIDIKDLRLAAALCGLLDQIKGVLHLGQLYGGADLDKVPQHHALHRYTLIDDLVDDVDVDGGDDRAFAGDDLYKMVLLQPLQHAADGGAGYIEALAQLVFAQCIIGRDLEGQDLAFQRAVDLVGA